MIDQIKIFILRFLCKFRNHTYNYLSYEQQVFPCEDRPEWSKHESRYYSHRQCFFCGQEQRSYLGVDEWETISEPRLKAKSKEQFPLYLVKLDFGSGIIFYAEYITFWQRIKRKIKL